MYHFTSLGEGEWGGGGGACTENNVQTNSCGKNIQLRSFTRWGVRGSFWENGKHNSITR